MFKQAVLLASLLLTAASSSPPTSQRILDFSRYHDIQGSPLSSSVDIPSMTLKAQATTVYRPRSLSDFHSARIRSARRGESQHVDWDPVEVLGPNVQDIHTLSQLARMSGNAYSLPGQKSWYDLDGAWNTSFPYGWEDAKDGFRGHVFISSDNSTVVLAIKGTTVQGTTSKKDKFNDNLLFSCCCAHVDFSWVFRTVCHCYRSNWRCDNSCVSDALVEDSMFYSVGVNLVNDLLILYPSSDIWLVGHSLGGALASLLGSTFGLPAVAFESPGTCTGFASPCAQGGYALETRCHLGKSIVFDTVNRLGWRVDIRNHVIKNVILKVLEAGIDWEEDREVPIAREEEDCVDCFKWDFE
ncbi:alpha/beta-hydrolase [Hymenopellis radicata]|nr:alpha/beta-hydrolase [Hymenopellis radicata]